ncbi:MAG: hypothetical protein CM1200mP3_15200 [Chloroflexota bacterium]|nr:MAG: hypothetical protein CM1200mP3_15200 [Chloroflexota bacterium]
MFEISPPDEGRMSVIAGGGRYDGLLEELGGSHTPGIGFGMGIERVIENIRRQNISQNQDTERISWSLISGMQLSWKLSSYVLKYVQMEELH